MAVTYVGVGVSDFGTGAVTLNINSSTAAGDTVLAFVETNETEIPKVPLFRQLTTQGSPLTITGETRLGVYAYRCGYEVPSAWTNDTSSGGEAPSQYYDAPGLATDGTHIAWVNANATTCYYRTTVGSGTFSSYATTGAGLRYVGKWWFSTKGSPTQVIFTQDITSSARPYAITYVAQYHYPNSNMWLFSSKYVGWGANGIGYWATNADGSTAPTGTQTTRTWSTVTSADATTMSDLNYSVENGYWLGTNLTTAKLYYGTDPISGTLSNITFASMGYGSTATTAKVLGRPGGGWIVVFFDNTNYQVWATDVASGASGWSLRKTFTGYVSGLSLSAMDNANEGWVVLMIGDPYTTPTTWHVGNIKHDPGAWSILDTVPAAIGAQSMAPRIVNTASDPNLRLTFFSTGTGTPAFHAGTGLTRNLVMDDPGNHQVVGTISFSGADPDDPIEAYATGTKTTTSTSSTIAGATTAQASSLGVIAFGTSRDAASTVNATSWTNAGLTNLLERIDQTTNAGGGGGIGVATGNKSGTGSYGDTVVALAATQVTTHWMGVLQEPSVGPSGDGTLTIVSTSTAAAGAVTENPNKSSPATAVTVSKAIAATATSSKPTDANTVVVSPLVVATGTSQKSSAATAVSVTETVTAAASTNHPANATAVALSPTALATGTGTHPANAGSVSIAPIVSGVATNNKLAVAGAVTVTETTTAVGPTLSVHLGDVATAVATAPSASATVIHLANAGAVSVTLAPTASGYSLKSSTAIAVTKTPTTTAVATNNKLSTAVAVTVTKTITATHTIDHRGAAATTVAITPLAAMLKTSLATAGLTTVTEAITLSLLANHLANAAPTTANITEIANSNVWRTRYLQPDALLVSTGLTGPVSYIQDSPASPDGNALTPTGGAINLRMSFQDPGEQLRQNAGDQIIRVKVTAVV